MAAELTVLNPVAQLASELGQPPSAPQRPRTLEGSRVGLYWNRKPGGNYALERVGQLLKERFPGTEAELVHSRRPIPEDLIRELKESRDVVVGATAD
jgi:hypothetical protein|tara:strand:- start:115 stop:405 length:291 start_codon:yes stop_codon:yes gene_type:complete